LYDATPPPLALAALVALRRARLRAIEIARATNTGVVESLEAIVPLLWRAETAVSMSTNRPVPVLIDSGGKP
jgi:post-segregation antitoxin (ccd killing protein)